MFTLPVTKTDIAKTGLKMTVASTVTGFTATAAAEQFDKDVDDFVIDVPSTLFGYYVASKLEPVTDAVVDKTISRYKSWRSKKNQTDTAE